MVCVLGTSTIAASVDFEGLPTSFLTASETIEGFTFNSQNGSVVRIFNDNPNPRTTYVLPCLPADCSNPLEIIFQNATNVSSMNLVSDEGTGTTLNLLVQTHGGPLALAFSSFDGIAETKDFVSFSGLNGATSVPLTENDPAGLGYDGVRIDAVTPPIPLPAGLPLLTGGLGLMALLRRRA